MSDRAVIEIVDVVDEATFGRLPPCADPRFDHRSCDYWEDEVRGSKSARRSWWQAQAQAAPPVAGKAAEDNPFASPSSLQDEPNPFLRSAVAASLDPLGGDDLFATPAFNPFAPPERDEPTPAADAPRKLRLLGRGLAVFGPYAKVLVRDGVAAVYAQYGPLSAYPRAQQIRSLYPDLPQSPLPAVFTCIASTQLVRGLGLARRMVEAVAADLAARGFAAVEAYPDPTLRSDEASAAEPGFWERCGFVRSVADERYPVMRREL